MYKCSFCKKVVPPRTSCKKVINSRVYHHPFRPKVQRRWGYDKMGRLRWEWVDDKGGIGPQIISECPICADCALIKGTL
jgi:hypothetical protein